MNKQIHSITIILMAMAMGSFLFTFGSSDEHNHVEKKHILQTLEQERNKTKQAIEEARKNNDPLLNDWSAKDLALHLTERCIKNHPSVTEKDVTKCFAKSFDFIRDKPAYADIEKILKEFTEAEYVIIKESKEEGSATLQQK